MFNEGYSAALKTMQSLGLKMDSNATILPREPTRSASPEKTGVLRFQVKRPEQPADSNIWAKNSFLKSLKGNSMDQESLISILMR